MSGTDKFTKDFKQKSIEAQARRQIPKIERAGATHIEWHISHEHTVVHMKKFLETKGISNALIKVIHTPMK